MNELFSRLNQSIFEQVTNVFRQEKIKEEIACKYGFLEGLD